MKSRRKIINELGEEMNEITVQRRTLLFNETRDSSENVKLTVD